jgi:hypothetical protein
MITIGENMTARRMTIVVLTRKKELLQGSPPEVTMDKRGPDAESGGGSKRIQTVMAVNHAREEAIFAT